MTSNTDVSIQIRLNELRMQIKACAVIHPRVQRALDLMSEGHEAAAGLDDRSAVMILGESRTGKTKLLAIFREGAAEYGCNPERILYVSLAGPTTVAGLITSLLEVLGDPMPDQGEPAVRKRRLYDLLKEKQIAIVQIDEAQQLIDHRSDEVCHDVADFFKGQMNPKDSRKPKLPVCWVLAGTPGLQRLLRFNSQVENRFFGPLELQLFSTEKELDIKDLRVLLISLEKQIQVAKDSRLGTTELAIRFRLASGGCIGIIVDLIHQAGRVAIRDGRDRITVGDLADASDLLMTADKFKVGNPFRAEMTAVTQAALARPKLRADRRGVGRRSRAKRREVKVGDVVNLKGTP